MIFPLLYIFIIFENLTVHTFGWSLYVLMILSVFSGDNALCDNTQSHGIIPGEKHEVPLMVLGFVLTA